MARPRDIASYGNVDGDIGAFEADDGDGDGVLDTDDNCPADVNALHIDTDRDGLGVHPSPPGCDMRADRSPLPRLAPPACRRQNRPFASRENTMKTTTFPLACIVVATLLAGGCATAPRSAADAPPSQAAAAGDPFAAVLAQANLPPGVPGQTRESLEAEIAARGGEILAREADKLVARGRSSAGVAVDVEYPLRDGRVVARGSGASAADRPR